MRILVDKMPQQQEDCIFCVGYKASTWATTGYYVCGIDPSYQCVHTSFCPFCKELTGGNNNDFSRINSNDRATRQ